ncbi:XRE family transcriptional regulator [Actinomadura citrea]|uniref:XRE family transcriptional regulator n=1 Tax=Actinomadura citrea TaxID=46158 RepID=UPI003CE47ED7
MSTTEQLRLLTTPSGPQPAAADVAAVFDPARLTQARQLAGMTKTALAQHVGVSAAAVGQWESSTTPPRPDHLTRAAEALEVPIGFFALGRPYARLDASAAHFRCLRSTRASQRAKAIRFVEQIWELAYALEKRVRFPAVDLPGFRGGEPHPGEVPADPAQAAQVLRRAWQLGDGPIPHLVRTMETHGLLVTMVSFAGADTPRIDAFATSRLPRPTVVLTPDRADDVYEHRFAAAHELGHLLLHADIAPGDKQQEREADAFAAELLTPAGSIGPLLPARLNFPAFTELSLAWGVSLKSLIYRSRELGLMSEVTARRGYQRIEQMRKLGLIVAEPVTHYPGETPCLLAKAFTIAQQQGLTHTKLAGELQWRVPRVRKLLGDNDSRPELTLITTPRSAAATGS